MSTPKYEIFDDGARKGEKIVIERHLNFEYRYEITKGFIRDERDVWFYPVQIRPSIQKCEKGKCTDVLCTIPDDEFTDDVFEWTQYYTDPTPLLRQGQKVLMDDNRVVTFMLAEEAAEKIDLNWRRLRNMAQPIVDEQLGKLAMNQSWRDTPMKLNLGSLLVDTKVVRIDEASYYDMSPNGDATDMDVIEATWKKSKSGEKRVSMGTGEKEDERKKKAKVIVACSEYRKNGAHLHDSSSDEDTQEQQKENVINGTTYEESNTSETNKTKMDEGLKEDESTGGKECKECCEEPCVWLVKRDEMIDFDCDEHDHMPDAHGPPNNIRRKKVYRQMVLYLNEGGTGKGVRVVLPKCVENGVRKLFPSPTFMGFKAK
jgi:hypothetical protein